MTADPQVLQELSSTDRLRLMKFVCSFAWADLEVHPEERSFVERMVQRLGLAEEESAAVQGWLAVPPAPESVDPTQIPVEHRRLFVRSIKGVILADGEIAPEESENLALLEDLLGGH